MNGPWDEITLAVGTVLIGLGIAAVRQTRRFIARCLTTEGTIVGYTTSVDSDSGQTYYYPVTRFVDPSGTAHEIGGPHGAQEPPPIGTVESITYDPSYPTNAWVTGTSGPWAIPWLVLIIGFGAIVGGVVMRLVP